MDGRKKFKDQYGFMHSKEINIDTIDSEPKYNTVLLKKWKSILEDFETNSKSHTKQKSFSQARESNTHQSHSKSPSKSKDIRDREDYQPHKSLKLLCRKGVPAVIRGEVWQYLCNASSREFQSREIDPYRYEEIFDAIDCDINRCYPGILSLC